MAGNNNFGLKIGVEGEKQFKNSLRDINSTFKVLGSEMRLVSSEFDKNDKSVQAVSARNHALNKSIDAQKEKISTLENALKNANDSFGENDKRTQNWAIQLNQAKANLNGMEKEFKNNNSAMLSNSEKYKSLGKEIDTTVQEYVKARNEYGKNSSEAKSLEKKLNDLASQQKNAGKAADDEDKEIQEVTKSLGLYQRGTKDATTETEKQSSAMSKIASGLKATTQVVAGVVTGVAAATAGASVGMFKMAESASDNAKEVNNMSQKLNLSREGFQEWSYILKKSGTSIDVMGTGMKTLQKTMGGLTEDGDSSAKAFDAVGIKFDEIKGKSPEEALNRTIKALQNMPAGSDRTAAALKLFGKGAMDLEPLLNKTCDQTDELRKRAHDLGLVMGDEQVNAGLKFKSTMGKINDTLDGVKMQMVNAVVPSFSDGLEAFLSFATGAEGGQEKMNKAIEKIVQTITTTIPQFIEKGAQVISALVTGISQALPKVAEAIGQVLPILIKVVTDTVPVLVQAITTAIPSILGALLQALPQVANAAVQIVLALVNGISEMFPTLIPQAVQAIVTIVQGLMENLPLILDAALQLILGLADGLLASIPILIEAIPSIIDSLVQFLITSIPKIIEAGIKLLTSIVTALPTIIDAVVKAIPVIIQNLITAIINAIPLLIDAGVKLLISLVQNLPTIINSIVSAIPQIIQGITGTFANNIDKIIMAGVQLLVALVQNMPQIVSAIVGAIPQIITGIINAFTSYVSTMVDIGFNLISGIWNGISDAAGWLQNKISGFCDGVVDGIKGFFGIKSPSTLFRDEIGKNMALGLGIGFENEMDGIAKDMQDSIPTSLDVPKFDINTGIHTAIDGAVSMIDLSTKVDRLTEFTVDMFPKLLEAMDIKVVLDDGTLVGKLAPEMNKNLAVLKRRNLAF